MLAVVFSLVLLKQPAVDDQGVRAASMAIDASPRPLVSVARQPVQAAELRSPRLYEAQPRFPAELERFADYIRDASDLFGVPQEIIASVIMQESHGDPLASARTTSARGLMQTISSTFTMAKEALAQDSITIRTPFSPKDSILAGTWYLADCFRTSREHFPYLGDGSQLKDWEKALQYYYVGPALGRDAAPMVKVRRRGEEVYVNKAHYSRSVLARSQLIAGSAMQAAG